MHSTAERARVAGPVRSADRVAALLVSASAIRYAGQLVLLVLIAHSAGARGVGTYTVALAICAPVFIIAGFGIRTVRLTLRRSVSTRTYERFLLTSMVCATALVAVISLFLPGPLATIVVIIALLRTSETFADLCGAMLQRAGRPGTIVAVMAASVGLQVAVVAFVFAVGGTLVIAMLMSAAAHVLVLLTVTRPLARATTVEDPVPPSGQRGGWQVLFAAGLPTGIAIGMITLLSTMPQYLLGWVGGVEDAGLFAVVLYAVVAVEVLLHGLAQSWIPQARVLHEGLGLTPSAVTRTALRWTLLAGTPGLVGLGAAALLLPVVLGPEFRVTAGMAVPLAVTILLVPASFAADTAVVVRNRYGLSLTVSVLALVVGSATGAGVIVLGSFTLTAALWTFAVTMAVRAGVGFVAVLVSTQRVTARRALLPQPRREPRGHRLRRQPRLLRAARLQSVRLLVDRYWPVLPIGLAVVVLVAAGPAWALGVTGAVVLVLVLTLLRTSVPVLLVMTVPLAIYVRPGGMLLNLSVSDVFVLLLLIRILVDPDCLRAAAHVSMAVRTALTVLALFLAVSAGTVLIRSGLGAPEDWTAFVADTVKLVVVIGYFIVCAVVFRDLLLRRDHRFLTAWAWAAALVGGLGTVGALLYQQGTETGLTMDFRATGTFEDPNAFATYLILSLPIVLAARLLTQRSILSWHLVPIVAGIIASFSRGALVGLAPVLVLLCILALRDRALRALRIVIVAAVVATAVLVLDGAVSSVFQGSRGVGFGEDIRFRLWAAAIDVFVHAPVTGVGIGQFIVSSEDLLGSAGGVLAHNTYLSVLAEGGLVGAALLLAIPLLAIAGLLRRGGTVSHLLLASGAGAAVMAVSLNLQNFRPLWMLLALAVAWSAADPAAEVPTRPHTAFPHRSSRLRPPAGADGTAGPRLRRPVDVLRTPVTLRSPGALRAASRTLPTPASRTHPPVPARMERSWN